MEPTNNQNPTPNPLANGGITPPAPAQQTPAEQIDQQAVEAAKNIIAPTPAMPEVVAPVVPAAPMQDVVPPPPATQQMVQPTVIAPQVITPQNVAQTAATPLVQPTITPTVSPQAVPTVYGQETPAMVMGGVDSTGPIVANINTVEPNKPSNKKKFVLFGGIGAFLLVGGAAAFAFLWYIPNLPNNVWKTGFSRTGDQVDFILKKLNEPKSMESLQKNKVTLKGSLKYDDQSFGIDLDTKYDKTNTSSTVKVSGTGAEKSNNYNIDAELRTQVIQDAVFPNIYFKISGFSSLGLDALSPNINQYDNKWIAVEQDYLKQFEGDNASKKGQENITQQDVMSIANDANAVTQQYVFTNDPKKAVVQQVKFIGTEKSEGIKANHYKAKLNADNVKAYCTAMVDKLSQNASLKKISTLSDAEFSKEVQTQKDECGKAKVPDAEFDLWIDKNIKVLHKVRVYEDLEKKKQEQEAAKAKCLAQFSKYGASYCSYYDENIETGERYQEFGQVFKSKDQILFFVGSKSATNRDKSTVRADITVDAKKLTLGGTVKANSENEGSKYTLDLTMATEPYTGAIDSGKPAGAIPLQQVLDKLGDSSPF